MTHLAFRRDIAAHLLPKRNDICQTVCEAHVDISCSQVRRVVAQFAKKLQKSLCSVWQTASPDRINKTVIVMANIADLRELFLRALQCLDGNYVKFHLYSNVEATGRLAAIHPREFYILVNEFGGNVISHFSSVVLRPSDFISLQADMIRTEDLNA
ncbi:hypothetical protein T02_4771 [Trichinella nativa]|uniref:Uncharacterized protein n=1 Tax=Trichinella nativa TaxID=6335 RepID=A0A0V1KXQ7_9BILA|nr:hypothetical protein T02_4771 [Trichinella nativa]